MQSPTDSPAPQTFFTPYRMACLAVLALSLAVYLPSLTGLFLWDDTQLISARGTGGATFAGCFTHPFLVKYYRPLVSLSFLLDRHLYRPIPFLYHQTNLFLHVLTTGLLIGMLRALLKRRAPALIGGLLFGVQPAQVGAVAWIGGRTDALAALFVVIFGWLLILVTRDAGRSRAAAYGMRCLLLASYAAALFTKEQTIGLLLLVPLSLVLLTAPGERPCGRAVALRTLPFVILALLYIVLWQGVIVPSQSGMRLPLGYQVTQAGNSMLYYALMELVPTPRWMHTLTLTGFERMGVWSVLAGFLMAAAAVWLGLRARRSHPEGVWLGVMAGVLLLPVCHLLPVPSLAVAPYRAAVAGPAVAGCLALLIMAGFAVQEALRVRMLRAAVLLGLVIPYAALTAWGAGRWQDTETIFTTIAKYDPGSLIARYNLATACLASHQNRRITLEMQLLLEGLFGAGWRDKAFVRGEIRRDPMILIRVAQDQGNAFRPEYWLAESYNLSGAAYLNLGESPLARQMFTVAVELNPGNMEAASGLGICALRAGDYKTALKHLRFASQSSPQNVQADYALAQTYIALKDWSRASTVLRTTLRYDPYLALAYVQLARAQLKLGDRASAIAVMDSAANRTVNWKVEAHKRAVALRAGASDVPRP